MIARTNKQTQAQTSTQNIIATHYSILGAERFHSRVQKTTPQLPALYSGSYKGGVQSNLRREDTLGQRLFGGFVLFSEVANCIIAWDFHQSVT